MVAGQVFLPVAQAQGVPNYALVLPSQTTYEVDQTVIITGQNLDQLYSSGFICFNNLNSCFQSSDALVKEWSYGQISFIMPYASNVTQSGQILLVGGGAVLGQFPYSFKPHALGYLSNSALVTEGAAGSVLQIKGLYFGDSQGVVRFGQQSAMISSWSDMIVNLTIPGSAIADSNTIEICTAAGVCMTENFLVKKQVFSDTLSGQQYYLNAIKYVDAYNTLTPKDDVVVAVLDEGIDFNQEDLKGSGWLNSGEVAGDSVDNDKNGFVDDLHGYNFVDNSADISPKGDHGTEVAGVIGAGRNNGVGITGIAPKVKLMSLIVCHADGSCDGSAVLKAIKYAVDAGARIVNLSLEAATAREFDSSFNDVVKYAYDHNVLVVVAAGNGDTSTGKGRNLTVNSESPVCNDNGQNMILGVGASNKNNDSKTAWSNYGACVDIFAPGEKIITTKSAVDSYATVSGTSFATPIVAAVAANIFSAYPDMKNSVLIDFMIKNGSFLDTDKLFDDVKASFAPKVPVKQNVVNVVPASPAVTEVVKSNSSPLPLTSGFSDVNKFNKNFQAIVYLRDHAVVAGYPDGTFRSEQGVTRAEMLKILIRGGLGITPGNEYQQACFTDVGANEWYANYVCYAKSKGWTEGYVDGTFQPNKMINKVEAIKFLALINNLPKSNLSFLPYLDVPEGAWYEVYLKEAFQMGLLEEVDNMYEPDHFMTRGSISESIYRLMIQR